MPQFKRFDPAALRFLKALKRNNRREWFHAHKQEYEDLLRAPMVALVERLAGDVRAFAPELVVDPRRSIFRIYRDTRFSADKRPLKTHISAHFPNREIQGTRGAGLYFEVAPGWVWIGGGLYAPETSELHAVREQIAANPRHLRAIVESPAFRRAVGPLDGERLQRVPRGFPPDHEAAEYLKFRQFIGGREFPAGLATSPRFYATLVSTFRKVAPLVKFLNDAITSQRGAHDRMAASMR